MAPMMYFVTVATVIAISVENSLAMPSYDGTHYDDMFTCNDYESVTGRMSHMRNNTAIESKSQEIFEDMRLNREEVLEIISLICQESARVAILFEEEIDRCPDAEAIAIEHALQHPGPSCTASGDLSEFASNVIANFTEFHMSRNCNRFIGSKSGSCHRRTLPSNMGIDFTRDMRTFESSKKEMIRCVLRELDGTNDCENIDSVKRAFVMVTTTSEVMTGVEFKYDDFF